MYKLILIISLILGNFVSIIANALTYTITESPIYSSLDPLDADQTQNLAVMRMLYATPVELDSTDQLKSAILESFTYNPQTFEMKWKLRKNLKYSDGTPIRIQDLKIAVLRMAKATPKFPVLEKIKGLDQWLRTKEPLTSAPVGVHSSQNELKIQFSGPVEQPLVRFSLELFSILPGRCIDLKTGKIICSHVPSSGPYVIAEASQNQILFKKRPFNSADFDKIPDSLTFRYTRPTAFAADFLQTDLQTVVAGSSAHYDPAAYLKIQKTGKTLKLPTARFMGLLINPNVAPLGRPECRLKIAEKVRAILGSNNEGAILVEGSIFTQLLPGFISYPQLKNEFTPSATHSADAAASTCKELEGAEISWGYTPDYKHTFYNEALRQALKELKVKATEVVHSDNTKADEGFITGGEAFRFNSSGFWAFDPAGDVQMLFTPGLHDTFSFVSDDKELQSLIQVAKSSKEAKDFEKVNRYLFSKALYSVVTHSHRFYWSPNPDLLKSAQFGTTAPAPWQVFTP
jgi:ABC-type transport system substrate-binding protein